VLRKLCSMVVQNGKDENFPVWNKFRNRNEKRGERHNAENSAGAD